MIIKLLKPGETSPVIDIIRVFREHIRSAGGHVNTVPSLKVLVSPSLKQNCPRSEPAYSFHNDNQRLYYTYHEPLW